MLSLVQTILICTNSIASLHTKAITLTKTHTHLVLHADPQLPGTSIWFHMAFSSITTSDMDSYCWEPLLLSHLIHLLADQWDSYWNGLRSSVSSTGALTACDTQQLFSLSLSGSYHGHPAQAVCRLIWTWRQGHDAARWVILKFDGVTGRGFVGSCSSVRCSD